MMGLFLSAYDKEEKEVTLEFVSTASIASTKPEVLMDKVQEMLLNNNTDICNTRFSCLHGTNTMPGERTGLQRRIHNVAPFILTVDVIVWHYALSIYLINFLGLNQLTDFYLSCGEIFTILEKTY